MKVIYTAKRGILETINGEDNSATKKIISDFYKNKINVNPITTMENRSKFNTVTHNGFEYTESMLHEYCRMNTEEGGIPMSYWGNLLQMIDFALETNDGICNIWEINLIAKCDVSILDELTPLWLPNSSELIEEVPTQKKWRNWRGKDEFFQNGSDVYFLTFTDSRLDMSQIKKLKEYSNENPSFNMLFLSNTEFRQERETWQ